MAVTEATSTRRTVDRRRVAVLYITPQVLVEMAKHNDEPFKLKVTAGALPADAEAMGIDYDVFSGTAKIVVRSASFDIVDEGVMPPTLPAVEVTMISERSSD